MYTMLFYLLLLLVLGLKGIITEGGAVFDNIIYVNQTGSNDQGCWKGNYWNPCSSVNLAIQGIKNRTVIYIQKGNYNLTSDASTHIRSLSNIGIIGNGSAEKVVINCNQNAGLSFNFSDNIELRNISLVKCGTNQISTSKKFEDDDFAFVQFRVAVYILLCLHITIDKINIENSNGTGLVMYNVAGNVVVTYSTISESKPQNDVGAGGLHIEFTYCIPGNTSCQNIHSDSYVPKSYSSHSTYFIHKNYIHSNEASLGKYYGLYSFEDELSTSMEFGAGGGISVIFKGNAVNNSIIIDDNEIINNRALYGGGFYFALLDNSMSNSILVSGLLSSKNSASINTGTKRDIWNTDGGGGGGKIMLYCSSSSCDQHMNSTIIIFNSSFSSNAGITGGGLDIQLDHLSPMLIEMNQVSFFNNSAFLGAAMYLVRKGIFIDRILEFNLSIIDCTFSYNAPTCITSPETSVSLPCSGVIYLSNKVPLKLYGELIFANNNASPLELHSCIISIAPYSKLFFENNTSDNGGGIALYECSYLIVRESVNLVFQNNTAQYEGGAIYAEKCSSNEQATSDAAFCFLQNDETGENFTFYGNTAGGIPNAIYTGSVIPCYQSSEQNPTFWNHSKLNEIFCWNYFHYEHHNDCTLQRKSDPAFMTILEPEKPIYPGESILLPIGIYDGWNISMQNVSLQVCVYSGPVMLKSPQTQQLSACVTTINKEVTIFHKNIKTNCSDYIHQNFTLKISLNDNKQFNIRLPLNFAECPNPFATIDNKCSQCTFKKSLASNSLHCSSIPTCGLKNVECGFSSYVYVSEGQCLSLGNKINNNKLNMNKNNSFIVIGHCPHYYYNHTFCKPILNLTNQDNVSLNSCSNEMSGQLCGKCKHGGIAVNSPSSHCGNCHKLSGLIFFGAQIVPLTIFILLILVFHITITSPGMNAFIFFSQVVTLDFPGSMYPSWIRDSKIISNNLSPSLPNFGPLMLPYSIWNMNFIFFSSSSDITVCITKDMDTVEVLGFQYVIALYPLVVLLLLYIWNRFYENGFRPIHYITCPIHQILARMWRALEITPSLMDSCVVIFIICFTKIALTSLKLLHYTTWYSLDGSKHGAVFYYDGSVKYFQAKHLGFGASAILFLLIFVACPVIYLLLYPCMWFQKLMDKCKVRYNGLVVISDIFMGAFRDCTMSSFDYRYCAGLYLLFRIICICLYYITDIQLLLIVETGFSLIVAGFFMICRPYKRNINNLIDFSVFLLLFVLSGLCLVAQESHLGLRISGGLLFVPLIVFSVYALHLFFKRVKMYTTKCLTHRRQANIVNPDNEQNSDEEPLLDDDHLAASFPDRIENPNRYQQHNQSNISQPLSDEDYRLSSEATGYTPPTDNSTGEYGSIQYRPNKHSTI